MYELTTTSSDGKLYQWNTNCKIWCDNADYNGREVQFDIANKPTAPVVNFSSDSNGVIVNIPNIVLQYSGILHVYIMDSSGSYVEDVIAYMVHKRHKPDDYVYTEETLLTYKTLITRIDELESEIDTISSRVDNLASLSEGSTTLDAELIDIRVGADGTTYDSAGNAVRSQIKQNKRDINVCADTLDIGTTTDYTFVAGGISSDGTVNSTASNRVRSENYIFAKAGSTISVKSGSTETFNIATYSDTETSALLSYRGMSSDPYTVEQDCYIRFGITASDTSDPNAVVADTIDMNIITDTLPDVRAQTDQNAKDISQLSEEIANVSSTVINVLNRGVANTGSGNQAGIINGIIDEMSEGDTLYLPNGKYRITEPIVINKPIKFICAGWIYCVVNDDYGVRIESSDVDFYARKITAAITNTGCIKVYSESQDLIHIRIAFWLCSVCKNCIYDPITFIADNYNVLYCSVSGTYLYGAKSDINGVSVIRNPKTTEEVVSMGEISIEKMRIVSFTNGIYVDDKAFSKDETTDNVNSVLARNVTFEHDTCAYYAKNVRSPAIIDCRTAEQITQDDCILITLDGCITQGVYFGRTPLKKRAVSIVNYDTLYSGKVNSFFINAPFYETNTGAVYPYAYVYDGDIQTAY